MLQTDSDFDVLAKHTSLRLADVQPLFSRAHRPATFGATLSASRARR